MRGRWTGLGLLLVVPWLTDCVSGRRVRLETGEGPPLVYTPPAVEPPPVEISQETFLLAMADLLLAAPLTIRPRHPVLFASWREPEDKAQQFLLDQCEPSESPDDCLRLPSTAPPPGTLARMRLAFSSSLDSLWEGATVPMAEYADPLAFKVMVYSAMITWLVILMAPEPVTKALAAALTLCLVAYVGLGPVWSMVKATRQFVRDCEQATTSQQLKLAGQRFNLVLGDNFMRLFLLLATAAIGGKASFLSKGPRLPAFSRAALHAPTRTGVRLQALGQVRTVALAEHELTIGLAPTAVAAVAMGPGGKPPPEMKGSLTGRPTRPGPKEKDEQALKRIERENESARILAENGYHVEQNPPPNQYNKLPDYKINGQYADCYTPRSSNARNILDEVAEKVNTRQADQIILNLDDSQVTIEALQKALKENPIDGLRSIIIIRNRELISFYP
jgi:hypothetical protein